MRPGRLWNTADLVLVAILLSIPQRKDGCRRTFAIVQTPIRLGTREKLLVLVSPSTIFFEGQEKTL
jgi:UDP:flavonoid glycosyltransferase YjiC (YdhE family)